VTTKSNDARKKQIPGSLSLIKNETELRQYRAIKHTRNDTNLFRTVS